MQFNKETLLSKNAAIVALGVALILALAVAACAAFGSDRDGRDERFPRNGFRGEDRASMRGAYPYGSEEQSANDMRPGRGYDRINAETDGVQADVSAGAGTSSGPVTAPPSVPSAAPPVTQL